MCDDGNTESDDGCSSDCQTAGEGYICFTSDEVPEGENLCQEFGQTAQSAGQASSSAVGITTTALAAKSMMSLQPGFDLWMNLNFIQIS